MSVTHRNADKGLLFRTEGSLTDPRSCRSSEGQRSKVGLLGGALGRAAVLIVEVLGEEEVEEVKNK